MSDFNTENEEFLEDSPVDAADSFADTPPDREQMIDEAATILINELTAIRISLDDRQQITGSFGQLNSNVAKQQQQIQTIVVTLEQLAKSLSADNLSKFLQIQKSFSAFAQKLEMFEQGINASIRRQQEIQKQADETYQSLNRGWRRLEDEVKQQRQIVGGIASWESFVILSIGTGFSAAVFVLISFKLLIAK